MCTSMTVRMFADRHGWPLEKVEVKVTEFTGPGRHLPESLEVFLNLYGPHLTEHQRQRLWKVAESCPVKQMLLGKMPLGIHTTFPIDTNVTEDNV
mmetsp:Transcript_1034/g.1459  ORF Transcript_1034/g.1459 Transcript_1034/m.1459 type:complete len:95 (-) Transcript_1034:90-374(-)